MKFILSVKLLCLILNLQTNADTSVAKQVSSSALGDITGLSASAIPYDKSTLQMRILWKTVDLKGTKLDVRLKPFPSKHCSPKSCYIYGLPSTTIEVLLPPDPMPILEHPECKVEAGCSYQIFVETADRKVKSTLNYSVPECIFGICSCKHAVHLPKTFVTANIEPSMLKISWNITSYDENNLPPDVILEAVDISVGIQMNPSLTWGGQYKNITEELQYLKNNDGSRNEYGEYELKLKEPLIANSQYIIRAHVIDNKGCYGEAGNYTNLVPNNKENTEYVESDHESYQWIFSFMFSIAIFLLMASMAYMFRRVVKRMRKINSIQNWRGVYHNVPSGAGNAIPHIVMQDNFCYVDKDILEARARGDADLLEVPHASLTIGREIGKGAFGRVYIARADNLNGRPGSQVVAVKKLKKRPSPDELEEFLSEIGTMKTVSKHPNVVSLIGCCTIKQPLLMIMEYVGYGDLLQYLRQVRAKHEARSIVVSGVANPRQMQYQQSAHSNSSQSMNTVLNSSLNSNGNLSQKNLSNTATTFGKYLELLHSSSSTSNSDASYVTHPDSTGMNRASLAETMYTTLSQNPELASTNYSSLEYVLDHKELHTFAIQIARGMRHLEDRQITHRDLAARNVLIDEHKTLKISDFGLSRTGIYVNTRNKKVPLRWLSIEAMRDNLYSSKSDIWAFGVVLWEIGTLGGFPYPTVGNHELLVYLGSGQRLQRPENCSVELYELMLGCWADDPQKRPNFNDILSKLEPSHSRIYVDFNELRPNYVFPPTTEEYNTRKSSDTKDVNKL